MRLIETYGVGTQLTTNIVLHNAYVLAGIQTERNALRKWLVAMYGFINFPRQID